MNGAAALPAPARGAPAGEFDHVLAGVALDGPAVRLAALLDRGFLAEAGWDAVARVLSLPAAHPLLGRRLCRVAGCASTAHGSRTGGVCWRCFTRLAGAGMNAEQIACARRLAPLPAGPPAARSPAACGCPRSRGRCCACRTPAGCAASRG